MKPLTNSFSRTLATAGLVCSALVFCNAFLVFFVSSEFRETSTLNEKNSAAFTSIFRLHTTAGKADVALRDFLLTGDGQQGKKYQALVREIALATDSVSDASILPKETLAPVLSAVQKHNVFAAELQALDSGVVHTRAAALPLIQEAVVPAVIHRTQVEKATHDASDMLSLNTALIALQVLLLIGCPVLVWLSIMHRRYARKLVRINHDIEQSNRKYVFNDHSALETVDDELVTRRLEDNLQKASAFIQSVSNGDYNIEWPGMTESNAVANQDNISGRLVRMRDQMKQVKEQDRIRMWVTEGLSEFGEVIRKNQENFDALLDILISTVVKYLNVQAGGLFILTEDEQNPVLKLRACYAFNRKKFIEKEVGIGDGLVGQVYLEGQTVYLTEVPQEYMSITSGLGEARPNTVLLVPLKVNDKVEGVLELASFRKFEKYEIDFLEKLGEALASSIVSLNTGIKTKFLLQQSQEQAEEMRAQEEEMRQNMEELEATQEQMARQVEEMNRLRKNLEQEQYLFSALMDNLPDTIYFKDRASKLIRISKHMTKAFGLPESELLGKSDFDFQDYEHAKEAFDDEQEIMRTRKAKIDYIEKETRDDGTEVWVSTTKMPLVNLQGEVVGTFGVSRDVSKLKRLEQEIAMKSEMFLEEERAYQDKIDRLSVQLKKASQK